MTRDGADTVQMQLVERLKEIPDGEISATARRSGLALQQLLKLRRGENTDIRLSTLVKIARGLGVTPASLISDPRPLPKRPISAPINPRMVRGLIKKTRRFVEDVQRFVETLPDEPEDSE